MDNELLDLSSAIVDAWSTPGGPPPGAPEGPTNRVTNDLTELDDGLAIIESFSNIVAIRTDAGLVLFDASSAFTGRGCVASLRSWSDDPVHTLVYTHGHVDHVGGSAFLAADAAARGFRAPVVIGHENVPPRFDRYRLTDGWNKAINARQFGPGFGGGMVGPDGEERPFLPAQTLECTELFDEALTIEVGGIEVQLHHDRGETDDHTWAWIPRCERWRSGTSSRGCSPTPATPEGAAVPGRLGGGAPADDRPRTGAAAAAHGLAVAGRARVATVLGDLATALERLVADVLAGMNAGATLDEIVHSVRVDDDLLRRPWLRPIYDEPEFVVRNTYRLFGGWWDGDPAHLKPPPSAALAAELATLAGGVDALAARAEACADAGDHRMACQLIELAAQASEDPGIWRLRSRLYLDRAEHETSLMAKGVYAEAARAGSAHADTLGP
ncbi:MAG: alkyl sulfatase dimerization domain-containing protein [Acidimicrobiales bacterium]